MRATFLLSFSILNGVIFGGLNGQDSPSNQENNASTPLIEENQTIIDESQIIKAFYELSENEQWREITDEVLASSDTPELGKDAIRNFNRRIFVFRYPSDGLSIKGFLSYTPQPEYHPLLILYRWGNEDFALMNPGVPYATYKNYTVIYSTLRGGVSEGNDEFGGKDVDDMKNLIQFIPTLSKELGIHLNPSSIFMLGPSRGGMKMLLTLARFPQLQKHVSKIVCLSAILDLHQLIQDRPNDMKLMFEEEYGLKEGINDEDWIAKRDPLNTATAINQSIPILIVQGTADDRIGLKEGERMVDALKKTGHDVSYWEVKGGNHVLSNHPYIMNDIARWLESDTHRLTIQVSSSSK